MATKANLDKALFYYPWYYKDWGSSRKVARMSLAERGLYRELLDCCWDQGAIPDDPEQLIELINCDEDEFTTAWPRVRKCFTPQEDGTLVNPKIEGVRGGVDERRKIRQTSGSEGGRKAQEIKRAKALAEEQLLSSESYKRTESVDPLSESGTCATDSVPESGTESVGGKNKHGTFPIPPGAPNAIKEDPIAEDSAEPLNAEENTPPAFKFIRWPCGIPLPDAWEADPLGCYLQLWKGLEKMYPDKKAPHENTHGQIKADLNAFKARDPFWYVKIYASLTKLINDPSDHKFFTPSYLVRDEGKLANEWAAKSLLRQVQMFPIPEEGENRFYTMRFEGRYKGCDPTGASWLRADFYWDSPPENLDYEDPGTFFEDGVPCPITEWVPLYDSQD